MPASGVAPVASKWTGVSTISCRSPANANANGSAGATRMVVDVATDAVPSLTSRRST